ncbi:unnamed protein product [Parnassius apollo]|uniref:(apollo) hypothetical protein n=1 Tax=Parnassius apollo TaxID=110799 RepID=A0A8S3WF18_PARAO|nr:unnamed protein product [Parnassius apollo]
MSSQKENTGICIMCRSSPSKDSSITLYRFPKPDTRNALRYVYFIHTGDMPTEAVATANLITYMDELFDGVNASTPDLRRGKNFRRT